MREASLAAAAARLRGDMEEYERQKARLAVLNRLYLGFGRAEDEAWLAEDQGGFRGTLEAFAGAGKWVAIGVGALLLLPYLDRGRR